MPLIPWYEAWKWFPEIESFHQHIGFVFAATLGFLGLVYVLQVNTNKKKAKAGIVLFILAIITMATGLYGVIVLGTLFVSGVVIAIAEAVVNTIKSFD